MGIADQLRVLVVGSGGREHALCWKIAQSPRLAALFCAPGNAGTADVAENVPIKASDIAALASWAANQRIDLTVVGPDDPLAEGIVDAFLARDLRTFGPTRGAARIEWSKGWAKQLCRENDVPTARYELFEDAGAAHRYVDSTPPGHVVKADGLALGKGVTVCRTREEAHAAVDALLVEGRLGESGRRVVVEELLVGREVSASVICDGTTYRMLPFACDYKPAFDGGQGPNTGGMGSYSPPTWTPETLRREVELRVVAPILGALRRAGHPFVGHLYPGLMLTEDGLRVIEFNARFGDPETQVLLPRLDCDLLEVLDRAASGRLAELPVDLPVRDDAACCVVMASGGYPGSYETGRAIDGLETLPEGVFAFHAGTRRDADRTVTAGGRVVGVTALGPTLEHARARAYAGVERVRFDAAHYRRDVGLL